MKRLGLFLLITIVFSLISVKAYASEPQESITYNAESKEDVFNIIQEAVVERYTEFNIMLKTSEDIHSIKEWALSPFSYIGFGCEEKYNDYYQNLIGQRFVHLSHCDEGILLKYTVSYRETKEETEYVEAFIKKWQKKNKTKLKGKSKLAKLKMFYNYIVKYEYDYDIESVSPYSLIINKKGTCMSYAGLLQKYCDMNGLECHIIRGENEEGVAHSYNIIKIKGKWYGFDATNDLEGKYVLFKYKDWQSMTQYPVTSSFKEIYG